MYDDEHAIMFQLQEARLASLDIPDRSFAELISQSPESTDWEAHTTSRSTALDDPIIFDDFWLGKDSSPQFGAEAGAGDDGDVTDLEDVVVIGDRPDEDDGGWQPGDPIPNPDGGGDPPPGDGGGGGGGPPREQPTDRPHDACEDRAADTLADDINDEISRQPDSNRREYGALIWRDDAGNLHRTALVPGNNSNVPFPANSNELGIDSYSRVVGIVHSHPSEVNLGTDAAPNWVPASEGYMHGGDWVAMDGWVSQNNLSINNFTVYISYQGQTREYDYADNRDPALRAALDSTGSQESGDYNPGATCP